MMKTKNFAVFIISHGRPEKQKTLRALAKAGYTGPLYIICDDEDKTLPRYKELYDNVIVFKKSEYVPISDRGDCDPSTETALYARNCTFPIARELGLDWVLELDDDYHYFSFKKIDGKHLRELIIRKNIDYVFDEYVNFLDKAGLTAVSMTQAGDYIGGVTGYSNIQRKRKCMNAWFFNVKKPFHFLGRMNDDVSTYVTRGMRGDVFLSTGANVLMDDSQQESGGLTELYKESGTYMKSFYTVMMAPSAVKINKMGVTSFRFHHKINWKCCVPKILRQEWKRV